MQNIIMIPKIIIMSGTQMSLSSLCRCMNLFLAILAVFTCNIAGYQVQIPNYELLKTKQILTPNFTLNYHDEFFQQSEGQGKEQFELLNERKPNQITFQIFIYPYRLYSYFDETNKKQFIFEKVGFDQFRQNKQAQNSKIEPQTSESLIENQFNTKYCLFGSVKVLQQSKQAGNQNIPADKAECLAQNQLYALLPQLLTITHDQHQQLAIQKINQEHLLIKNYASQNSTHQLKYFIIFSIFKVSMHSYLYEARHTFMQFLYEQKYLEHKKNQIQLAGIDSNANQSGEKTSQTTSQQQKDSFYDISVKQFFKNQYEIWNLLFDKNRGIFQNLFQFQNSVSVDKQTHFDYTVSSDSFIFVQINQKVCPPSTHSITYSFFSSKEGVSKDGSQKDNGQTCIYLTIHKTPFIQFQSPQPIEYVSRQNMLRNVKYLALGLVQKDGTQSPKNAELCIEIVTEQMLVEIWYGNSWKQIRGEYRNRIFSPVPHSQPSEQSFDKIFFLKDLNKVSIVNNTLTIHKRSEKQTHAFTQSCALKLQPFVLTAQKLNSELFVACVQGSKCMIINQKCEVINRIDFNNAFGLEWKYKWDYVKDKARSYISVIKMSQKIKQIITSPFDASKMHSSSLKTGNFHRAFQTKEKQNCLYEIKQKIIAADLVYKNTSLFAGLIPRFSEIYVPYQFKALSIFTDSVYSKAWQFKQEYLDYVLHDYLESKFEQFYCPNSADIQEEKVSLLNFNDNIGQRQFFNDCSYNQESKTIHFQDGWNSCKVIMKTTSLLIIDSFETGQHTSITTQKSKDKQTLPQPSEQLQPSTQLQVSKQLQPSIQQKIPSQQQVITQRRQFVQIFTRSNLQEFDNLMIVCSMHRDSAPYSKCKVSEYEITPYFYEGKRKVKFFLDGGRYFRLYFFNRKFITESKNQSFLELLNNLAHSTFKDQMSPQIHTKKEQVVQIQADSPSTTKSGESQLKQYKIWFPLQSKNGAENKHFDIYLRDYEKQQLQNISKILLVGYCIFFPMLAICCCIVCFKTYFQNILVYYGVIRVEASFRYPLNKLALKIKMRDLQQKGYINIHTNKKIIKITKETDTHTDIKFSVECCFCLEELKHNQKVVSIYCRHEYHSECFIEWVKNQPNTKCPLCKRNFTKTALDQFKQKSKKSTPQKPVRHYSDQNQAYGYEQHQDSNQIEIIEFQS